MVKKVWPVSSVILALSSFSLHLILEKLPSHPGLHDCSANRPEFIYLFWFWGYSWGSVLRNRSWIKGPQGMMGVEGSNQYPFWTSRVQANALPQCYHSGPNLGLFNL